MTTQVNYIFGTGQGAHDFDAPEYRTADGRVISFDPPSGPPPPHREVVETFINEDGRVINQFTAYRADWYFFVLRHNGQYEIVQGSALNTSEMTIYGAGETPSAAEAAASHLFDGE